jgi:hypothetical protein
MRPDQPATLNQTLVRAEGPVTFGFWDEDRLRQVEDDASNGRPITPGTVLALIREVRRLRGGAR